jgi:succinyl-CoA synthetase alpha subunit
MEPKDVSGLTSHVSARVNQTVQQKRTGQTSLLIQTETLLQDLLTLETLEIQDLLNPEGMKPEDRVSLQDHLIAAMAQDQVLDTVQNHLSAQLAMIVASAPIAQLAIFQAILSVDLEILEKLTSHVQTPESMTATVTRTVKTEFQETSLATPALLALATRTQTAKHSLRTRF